jgi:protein SCO1/2
MTEAKPNSPSVPSLAAVAVAIAAVAAGLWFGAGWFRGGARPMVPTVATALALAAGTQLPQPKPLKPFTLIDQDGRTLTGEGLTGHWTFAAIGYTTCPDVCPMTMATFVALARQIGVAEGTGPRFLLVSVDPVRDTPQRLAQYVRHFNPNFQGATGTESDLQALVRDLGALYARVDDPKSALGYTMDHSASIYLIDPQGRLAAIFSAPHDPAMMARDFATLTKGPVAKDQQNNHKT